jgi:hypothetical protein
MNSAPIKPLISTSDRDKIDVRIGTIPAVEDVDSAVLEFFETSGRNLRRRPLPAACRGALMMSVDRGKPEVTGGW